MSLKCTAENQTNKETGESTKEVKESKSYIHIESVSAKDGEWQPSVDGERRLSEDRDSRQVKTVGHVSMEKRRHLK